MKLEVLESALNEIVKRHEALRTRFEIEEDEPARTPVQVIDEWEHRRLEVGDLTHIPPEKREEEVRRVLREEAETGFDLSRGPLLKVNILKLGEEQHVLLYTMSRMVSDAWSAGVLAQEMAALYEAMSTGQEALLPKLEIQYADYASWQRQYLTGAALEKRLTYWKRQLDGSIPLLDLPVDHPRASCSRYQVETKAFSMSQELHQSLVELSRREGVTLSMLLLAAFKTLLFRYTSQEDITIGILAANRRRAEVMPLIGLLEDVLPMRTNFSGNPRFSELLRQVKDVALDGYLHQSMPFEELVEETPPESAAREMPLFNVAFGAQPTREMDLKMNGINVKSMAAEQNTAIFDLALWVTAGAEGMRLYWAYRTDLFKEETVIRTHSHFENLLFNIVDRPGARLTTLKVSSGAETRINQREQRDREESQMVKLMSIKRKGITLSTELA